MLAEARGWLSFVLDRVCWPGSIGLIRDYHIRPLNQAMTQDDWTTFVHTHTFGEIGVAAEPQWFLENKPAKWMSQIRCNCDTAVKIAIAAVDLVLPEWKENHPNDTIPVRAVDAARHCISEGNAELRKHAKALSKGCSDSRRRSLVRPQG